ncbi:MAG: amidohydrolase family protein [Candidatus Brocadiaceae bacterium]|jgi:predicted TIM-barrel fold metal-dependent hydrolase
MTIDVHTHAFPDELAPRAVEALNSEIPREAWAVLDGTVSDLVRSMDEAGIERSVICSVATAPKQVEPILRWSLEVGDGRVIPFGSVHPDCADPAAEARRIADAGLRGIKLHPQYQEFAVDERRMWPLYEAVAETDLILTFHAGRDIAFPPDDDRAAPRRILAVHRDFPTMPVVAAHMGGWKMWDEVLATLAGTDVYLETSYTFDTCDGGLIERILESHPPERILFGTDSPWRGQKETLELVREAFPDPDARRLVLGENARRLLGID